MAELGRGKPPFPEAYFVESRITEVEPGDTIMLRCIYDSSNLTEPTNTSKVLGLSILNKSKL